MFFSILKLSDCVFGKSGLARLAVLCRFYDHNQLALIVWFYLVL